MFKEAIIAFIIIIGIFSGDFITQSYTKQTVEKLTTELNTLKENLILDKIDEAKVQAQKIKDDINGSHSKLSYYLEHNEIEKVETNYTVCKSFVDQGEKSEAIAELEKTVFVLNHMTDKYSFSLENIF